MSAARTMDFMTLSSRILDDALQMGASAAEVFGKTSSSTNLNMHQGRIESIATAEEEGVGIRFLLEGGRSGYAFTADLSPENVRHILEEAFRGAAESDAETVPLELPGEPGAEMPGDEELKILSPSLLETPTGVKIDFIRALESAALGADKDVTWVDTLLYNDGWTEIHLRNSAGFHGSYRQTLAQVVLHVLARDDHEAVMSHHVEAACSLEEMDPARIGRKAGLRAAAPLRGKRIGPRGVTAVLDPPVASQLVESLAPSLLGRTYQRGRSLFQNRLGEKVASPLLTLVDDGRLPGGLSSSPFDGEGSPTGRTAVVEDGIFRRLLHDRRTSMIQSTASTGNAVRRSFRDLPQPGVTNLYVVPGDRATSEILMDLDQGFQVMNVMSVGGVNPVTGTFSVAASGVWLEEGREKYPVSGVTLSGDLNDMLGRISAVGNDLAWHHAGGSCGSPTLVVEGMTVAG